MAQQKRSICCTMDDNKCASVFRCQGPDLTLNKQPSSLKISLTKSEGGSDTSLYRRHHPADALPCRLLLAVVWAQISAPPSADSAAATALDVAQNFFGPKAVNRQLALMMASPTAFAFAYALDE